MTEIFPSLEHRESLQEKFKAGGYFWSALTDRERCDYHAYDYGWRRVVLNDRRFVSTLDPDGKWFDRRLVDQAEAMWRRKYKPQRREPVREEMRPPPWLDADQRKAWLAQADEVERLRVIAWAGPERLPNGALTPEMDAWVTAAANFARAWLDRWHARNSSLFRGPGDPPVDLEKLRHDLGMRASPSSARAAEMRAFEQRVADMLDRQQAGERDPEAAE